MKKKRKSRIRLTDHATYRYDSRIAQVGDKDSKILEVLRNGKDITWFKGDFRAYLNSKKRANSNLLVYEGNLYIFTYTKILITCYEIPEKFKDYENKYVLSEKLWNTLYQAKNYINKNVLIETRFYGRLSGKILSYEQYEDVVLYKCLLEDNNVVIVSTDDIRTITIIPSKDLEQLDSKKLIEIIDKSLGKKVLYYKKPFMHVGTVLKIDEDKEKNFKKVLMKEEFGETSWIDQKYFNGLYHIIEGNKKSKEFIKFVNCIELHGKILYSKGEAICLKTSKICKNVFVKDLIIKDDITYLVLSSGYIVSESHIIDLSIITLKDGELKILQNNLNALDKRTKKYLVEETNYSNNEIEIANLKIENVKIKKEYYDVLNDIERMPIYSINGYSVVSSKFGTGDVIAESADDLITVKFRSNDNNNDSKEVIKKFAYPDAITKGYLKINFGNSNNETQIVDNINKYQSHVSKRDSLLNQVKFNEEKIRNFYKNIEKEAVKKDEFESFKGDRKYLSYTEKEIRYALELEKGYSTIEINSILYAYKKDRASLVNDFFPAKQVELSEVDKIIIKGVITSSNMKKAK